MGLSVSDGKAQGFFSLNLNESFINLCRHTLSERESMQEKVRVKVDGIVLGVKEIEILKELADGQERVLWRFILDKNPSNYYSGVLFARIMKLNEKGLLLISNNGPKGGKTVRITERGLEVLRKLKV